MRIGFDDEDLRFQEEVRQWVAENYPAETRERIARNPHAHGTREDHVRWQQALYRKGWLVPHWPVEYGGKDWTPHRLYLFRAVLAECDVPDLPGSGVELLGPVLLRFATPQQKARYLEDLLSARTWWTQGFSEPGAGSDLAALQTRAERRGDRYVVNGSKIWTTNAHRADRMFALVRTSRGERKQQGISFLLLDMRAPGVEVRPIITLDEAAAGEHEVNEVFFHDVEVPLEDCLGAEGSGWDCAKYLLEFERARPVVLAAALRRRLRDVGALVRRLPPQGVSPSALAWQHRLAQLVVEAEALAWTELRLHAQLSQGASPGWTGSLLKTRETECDQRLEELILEMSGVAGLASLQPHELEGGDAPVEIRGSGSRYFNSRKRSIYGGTNEIQRNIIAKYALGLP
jgi:alkylation response protein AidB-like acyl-CoA dehydrogenase